MSKFILAFGLCLLLIIVGVLPPTVAIVVRVNSSCSFTVYENSVNNRLDVLLCIPNDDNYIITEVKDVYHGTASSDGDYVYYTPDYNYIGSDSLVVTITDIVNGGTDSFSVYINVIPLVQSKTLYVGGDGPGNYSTIQSAIDDAIDGDTVFVFNGIYNESVNIYKSINVIGENKDTTIIDGQKKKSQVVKLKANGITFSGFSVIHSKDWANDAGICIYSSYNIIKDNIISDNYGGEGAIDVNGDYNQIINNIIKNNKRDYSQGIFIGYQDHYNVVSGNIIDNNYWGIWLAANHGNVVVGNRISNNSQDGIMIRGVENYEIRNNIIENNIKAAIRIEWDSSNVLVYGNTIKNNGEGLYIKDAVSITVAMNSFYAEGIQLRGGKLNYWSSHSIYDNTINKKPINFYKSEKDLVVPSDTGQLILADCSNCTVKNLRISNVDYGIQIGFSNGINIFSNVLYYNVGNCIRIFTSSNNVIDNNSIKNNLGTGIVITGSSLNNEITKNDIINNDDGINIGSGSSLNFMCNNSITDNKKHGIYLDGSDNEIYRNNFEKNKIGVYLDFSYDNSISNNNFIKNTYPCFFEVDYTKIHDNNWNSNYYGLSLGLFPKLILGLVKTKYYWEDMWGEKYYFIRPGLNFDWNPARKPYDVGIFEI